MLHNRFDQVVLFEDSIARSRRFLPLTYTRPASLLRVGMYTMLERLCLLAEKEPSLQFTTPEELGELAVFFCSDAAKNVRGVAWNMDGGWAAQ